MANEKDSNVELAIDGTFQALPAAEQRKWLDSRFATDADFDAFCLDSYPDIHKQFSTGMSRTQKTNLLIAYISHRKQHNKESNVGRASVSGGHRKRRSWHRLKPMLLGALIYDWIRRVMNSAAWFTSVGSNSTILGAIGGGLLLLGGTLLYWQKDQGAHEHSQGGNKWGIAQNKSPSGHVEDLSIAMDMREWPPASAVSEDASEHEGQDNLGVVYRTRQRDAAVLNNPSQNVPQEMEPHYDLASQLDLAKDAAVVDAGPAKLRLAPMRLELIKIRPGHLFIPERSPIKIDYEFQISRYEITQNQYTLIMQSKDPSHFASTTDSTLPVENVSWLDAVRFCNELSDNHQLPPCYTISETEVRWIGGTGCLGYRLATEEEWLYAAHAGEPTVYSGSSEAEKVAWYFYISEYRTHPVGLKMPNAWKLYDMSGNVSEWVWDHHKAEHRGASYFTANLSNTVRTFLGGSFHDIEKRLLLSHRQGGKPHFKGSFVGLRVVKTSLAH